MGREIKEEFPPGDTGAKHYDRHVSSTDKQEFTKHDYPTFDEYEKAADDLAMSPVNSVVSGFIGTTGDKEYWIKYNRKTCELVVYRPDTSMHSGNKIITYYKARPYKFSNLKSRYEDVKDMK